MNSRFYTQDREAGNIIDCFETYEDAIDAILGYEAEDRMNNDYKPDFYEIKEMTIFDIAEENGLETVMTTKYKKGYPDELCDTIDAITGFESAEQLHSVKVKYFLRSVILTKKEGQELWKRPIHVHNVKAYKKTAMSYEYGGSYHCYGLIF